MKNGNRSKYFVFTLTSVAVSAISLGALAQQPPAGGQQPPGIGAGGAPGGGGFGGRQRGGPGGGGFNARFTTGTIAAGDASAGTITITPQGGAGSQVIKVNQDTTIETQTTISVKDLKVGDEVQVQGIPTGISATSITAGPPPSFMPGVRGRRPGQGAAGATGAAGAAPTVDANGNPLPPPPPPANAMANGKVVSVNPLTISVGDNMDIVLKMAKDAKITRYDKLPYSKLKVGDTIIASGAAGQDGMFTATGIGVNMQMGPGGGMFGAFGGGFGGGGGGLFPGGGGGGRGGRRGGGPGGPGGGGLGGGAGGGLPPGGN